MAAWKYGDGTVPFTGERTQNESDGVFLDYAVGGAREGESWKKSSWWIVTINGWTYPVATRGLNGDGVRDFGAELICAAWHTWQAASARPLGCEWLRPWATNTTNRTARIRATTLTWPCLVLDLPTISSL